MSDEKFNADAKAIFDQYPTLIEDLSQEQYDDLKWNAANASAWFNAFGDIESWMLERNWWDSSDISGRSQDTLINGLVRIEAELNAFRDGLRERDQSPKGRDSALAGSIHAGPVLEEHSPNRLDTQKEAPYKST